MHNILSSSFCSYILIIHYNFIFFPLTSYVFPILLFSKCYLVYILLSLSPSLMNPLVGHKYSANNLFLNDIFLSLFISFHIFILFLPLLFSIIKVIFSPKPWRGGGGGWGSKI